MVICSVMFSNKVSVLIFICAFKELTNCFSQLKCFEDQILETSDCCEKSDNHNLSGEWLKDCVSKKIKEMLDVTRVSMSKSPPTYGNC